MLEEVCCFCSVAKSCLTLCDTYPYPCPDCRLPDSSVHGISQARILEWVAISSPRGSSPPTHGTWATCVAGRFFTDEPPGKACVIGCFHFIMKININTTTLGKICKDQYTFALPTFNLVSLLRPQRSEMQICYPWAASPLSLSWLLSMSPTVICVQVPLQPVLSQPWPALPRLVLLQENWTSFNFQKRQPPFCL